LEHDGVCRASAGGGIIGGEQTVTDVGRACSGGIISIPRPSFSYAAASSSSSRAGQSKPRIRPRGATGDDDVRYAVGGPGAVDTVASSSLETAHREDFGGLAKWEEVQHEYCDGPMLLSRRLQP